MKPTPSASSPPSQQPGLPLPTGLLRYRSRRGKELPLQRWRMLSRIPAYYTVGYRKLRRNSVHVEAVWLGVYSVLEERPPLFCLSVFQRLGAARVDIATEQWFDTEEATLAAFEETCRRFRDG